MKLIYRLAKTFIKASSMSDSKDKGQKIKVLVLSIFALFGIMLPVVVGVGFVVNIMTETLMPMGFREFGLELMLYITSIFTVVFGINILFSELYFANDIEHILPLPLKAYQIVGGKFLAVYQMENVMQFMMVFSCILGYLLAAKVGVASIIMSILGILILPVMPLAVCGIVSILIMGATRLVRSKDIIHKMTIILSFAVLLVVVASITSLQNFELENMIENMATSGNGFGIVEKLFPNVGLYVYAIGKGDIVSFLGYIAVSLGTLIMMLVLGELLYFRGVIGLTVAKRRKKVKEIDELLITSRQNSQARAYFEKEIKLLFRAPAYLTNCIAVNFIWPVFIYAIYKIKGLNYSIEHLAYMYRENVDNTQSIIFLGVVGISILLTALGSISSNSFSREGKHFAFIKYIPMKYKLQWNVKVLVGGVFAAAGVMVYLLPFCILVRIPFMHTLMYVIISLLAILCVSYMGAYIDSIQPKLIWEDELNSLRENYNTFFAMAIAIGMVIVICVGGYFLFRSMDSIWPLIGTVGGVILVCTAIVMWMVKRVCVRYIEEQEEV